MAELPDMDQKVNRIEQIEVWIFELELVELSEKESKFLIEPAKDQRKNVLKDLVKICTKRYKNNTFCPDFSKIGVANKELVKEMQDDQEKSGTYQNIFMIPL